MMNAQSLLCASISSRAACCRARRATPSARGNLWDSSTMRSPAMCRCRYTQELVSLSQYSLYPACPHELAQGTESWLVGCRSRYSPGVMVSIRSEEHTSELQSHSDLVCRLL